MACYMYTLLAAVHSDKMRLRRFLFYLAKHEGGVMSAWPMFPQHIQQTIVQVAFKEGRGISGSSLFNFFFHMADIICTFSVLQQYAFNDSP